MILALRAFIGDAAGVARVFRGCGFRAGFRNAWLSIRKRLIPTCMCPGCRELSATSPRRVLSNGRVTGGRGNVCPFHFIEALEGSRRRRAYSGFANRGARLAAELLSGDPADPMRARLAVRLAAVVASMDAGDLTKKASMRTPATGERGAL